MPQSASASPASHPALAILSHPVTAIVVVTIVAFIWASVGFASALFTNDIVVSDGSYGLIRTSFAGPAALVIFTMGYFAGRGLRPSHVAAR